MTGIFFFRQTEAELTAPSPTHSPGQEGCFLVKQRLSGGDVAVFSDNPAAYQWPSLHQESKSKKAERREVRSRNLKGCYREMLGVGVEAG